MSTARSQVSISTRAVAELPERETSAPGRHSSLIRASRYALDTVAAVGQSRAQDFREVDVSSPHGGDAFISMWPPPPRSSPGPHEYPCVFADDNVVDGARERIRQAMSSKPYRRRLVSPHRTWRLGLLPTMVYRGRRYYGIRVHLNDDYTEPVIVFNGTVRKYDLSEFDNGRVVDMWEQPPGLERELISMIKADPRGGKLYTSWATDVEQALARPGLLQTHILGIPLHP